MRPLYPEGLTAATGDAGLAEGEAIIVRVAGKEYIVPRGLLYTESDEWVRVEDGRVRVGITDYAQKEMKDIVGVELPEVGEEVERGQEVAWLESIKASEPVKAPVSGRIAEVNERLLDEPELLNRDPYGEGWILVLEPRDPGELEDLMGPEDYAEYIRKRKS